MPLGLLGHQVPAHAQAIAAADAQDGPAPIIVTARLRDEDLQEVPVPISVTSGQTLDLQRIQSPQQLDNIAANLNITQANPRQTIFSIRGIGGTTQVSDGLDSSVGVYEDGVYLGRPGEFAYDFLDIDQVSVLRGPQGTLYGRNTIAGAINLRTVAPSFTPSAFVQTDFGNYAYRRFSGAVTGPLIDDKLAFRITGYDTHRSGFAHNSLLDTDENGPARLWRARPAAVHADQQFHLSPDRLLQPRIWAAGRIPVPRKPAGERHRLQLCAIGGAGGAGLCPAGRSLPAHRRQ